MVGRPLDRQAALTGPLGATFGRVRWSATLLLASLLGIAALVGARPREARADAAEDAYFAVIRALVKPDAAAALAILDESAMKALAASPFSALRVGSVVRLYTEDWGARLESGEADAKEPAVEMLDALVARIGELAERTAAAPTQSHPIDDDSLRVVAVALVARARLDVALGRPVGANGWFDAADAEARAAAVARGGRGAMNYLQMGIDFLADADRYKPAETTALLATRYVEARSAAKADGSLADHLRWATLVGIHADRCLAGDRKLEANRALAEVLDALAARFGEVQVAKAAWNVVLRQAQARGFEQQRPYLAVPTTGRSGLYKFDLPWGWTFEVGDRERMPDLLRLGHTSGTRQVQVHVLGANAKHTLADGSQVSGEDVLGMAQRELERLQSRYVNVTRELSNLEGPLNRHIVRTHGFELRGTRGSAQLVYRGWAWRGEHHPYTFIVVASIVGPDAVAGLDDEIEFVLGSIAELPPEKQGE